MLPVSNDTLLRSVRWRARSRTNRLPSSASTTGRMTQAFADRQTEVMKAIAHEYREKAEHEDAAWRLL